jgi:predicted Zn-dependent protease
MSRPTTSAPVSRREVIRDAVTTLGGRRHRENDGFTVLTRDELQGIAERALKRSTADGCEVTVTSTVAGNTRFAANQLATAGDVTDTVVTVNTSFGPKHAVVQINDTSDDAVAAAVARSEELAKLAPDDPDAMPPLGPQQYPTVDAYFEATASVTPEQRARAALTALQPARASAGADASVAAGYIIVMSSATLLANKAGLNAYHRDTDANYTLTVRTADGTGSGWAGADERDWGKIDGGAIAAHALEKARRSREAVAAEPGRYTVVLEPQAVGDLVQLLNFFLDARQADEGRSPFTSPSGGSKIGQKVADASVTLLSDPADPQLLAAPFDGEGYPLTRQVWIDKGVLTNLSYSRFWAKKQGKPFVGNRNSIKLAGGSSTLEDMIKSTERGVLVTRLWYLRPVDPRTALFTGLTRDGTYLIEHGAVTHPVKNFRFNDSPIFLLNNVEAMSAPVRLAGTEAGGDVAMPAVKAHDFNFTSLSDAV